MAASGEVPLRTLQEWMGHRDAQTTQIYAESPHEARMIERALAVEGHEEGHGTR